MIRMVRTARGRRERGERGHLPRSARPIPEDAKQPAYSAEPIKHLSPKFDRLVGYLVLRFRPGSSPLRMRPRKVRQDAYNVDPSRVQIQTGKTEPMRSADRFSGSNYRRARGRRENHANTQSALLWGRGPEAFGPRWREAAKATGWPGQRAQAPPRRSPQRRLSLGERGETSTRFRSTKFQLRKRYVNEVLFMTTRIAFMAYISSLTGIRRLKMDRGCLSKARHRLDRNARSRCATSRNPIWTEGNCAWGAMCVWE
jgi:hypothetical protein